MADANYRRQLLLEAGLDPSQVALDDQGYVIAAPEPPQSPVVNQATSLQPLTPKPLGSAVRQFGAGVLPAAGGLALGSLAAAPFTGGGSLLLPIGAGIIGSIAGGYGAAKLQEKVMPESWNQQLALDAEVNPKASAAGNIASSLVFMKPDLKSVANAAQGVRNVVTGGASKLSGAQAGNLLNIGLGGGLGAASSAYEDISRDKEVDLGKLAISAIGNALINNPNKLGQKLGATPNVYDDIGETQARQMMQGDQTTLSEESLQLKQSAERARVVAEQEAQKTLVESLPEKFQKKIKSGDITLQDAIIVAREEEGIAQRKAQTAAGKLQIPSTLEDIRGFGAQERGYEEMYSNYGRDVLSQEPTPKLKLAETQRVVENQLAEKQNEVELQKFVTESKKLDFEKARLEKEAQDLEESQRIADAPKPASENALKYLESGIVNRRLGGEEVRPTVSESDLLPSRTAMSEDADLLAPQTDAERIQEEFDLGKRKQDTAQTLTKDAEDLLESADAGGVPAFVTANLRRIAKENNIPLTADITPNEIIDQLRVKGASQTKATPVDSGVLTPEQRRVIQEAKAEVTKKAADAGVTLEPTVGFRDAMQLLAQKRGVKLEMDSTIDGAGETVSVAEQKRLRNNLEDVTSKINPTTAGMDTWPHELFHPFVTDMEIGKSQIGRELAKKAKEVFGGSEEVLTDVTGKEVITRLLNLDKEGRTKKFFKDFWSFVKTKYGNPTTADVKRLMANRLLNEVPYSELNPSAVAGKVGVESTQEEPTGEPALAQREGQQLSKENVTSDIIKATQEIESSIKALSEKKAEIKTVYSDLAKKWGFDSGEVNFEVVGGRAKGKPIKADSDVDVVFTTNKNMMPKSEEQYSSRNQFHAELNAKLRDIAGGRVHIVEPFGIKENVTPEVAKNKFADLKKEVGLEEGKNKVTEKDLKAAKFAGERTQTADEALPRQQADNQQQAATEPTSRQEVKDVVAKEQPLKLAFLDFMLGQSDKVKKVDSELGDAFEKFFLRKSYYEGKYSNTIQETVAKYKPEVRDRVSKYMMARDAGKPAPFKLTGDEVKLHEEIQKYNYNVRKDQNDLKIPVSGVREGKFNSDYFQNIMGRDVVNTLVNKGNSQEAANYRKLWREHIVEASEGKVTTKEANEIINGYIRAIGGKKLSGQMEFGAVRKADGYGLPPEMQEKDLLARMTRYGKRVAKDFAYFQELQSKETVAAKLGLHDPKGKLITKDGVESAKSSNEEVIKAIKMVDDDYDFYHPVTNAFNRLVTNSLLGPLSGARDIATIPVNVIPYINKIEDFGAFVKAIPKLGQAWKKSLQAGARRENLDSLLYGDSGNSGNYVVDKMNQLAQGLRVIQGREFLEQGARTYSYAIGEELTKANILRAAAGDKSSQEWVQKFGKIADGNEMKSAKDFRSLSQEDVMKITKSFVDQVQGSYDGRNLPLGIMEGPAAPFFALSRWSVEKANVIRKDVLEPLGRGNVKPFLMYSLGSILTGAVVEKLAEEVNNRRAADPTLNEAFKNSQADTDDQVGWAIKALQLGSFAGILSDVVKGGWDLKEGKIPQGFTYPAADFISNTLGQNLSDALAAIKEGEDAGKVMSLFVEQVAKNSLQGYRLVNNNFINEEDTKRSEKFRDKAVFETMTGQKQPTSFGAARSNPFMDTDYKEFKKAGTPEEAIAALKPAIDAAIRKSEGNPEKLKRELESLKRNSFQTMPSPENMPQEFFKYVLFLRETQGEEVAAERIQEYLRMNMLNKMKSKAVPAV